MPLSADALNEKRKKGKEIPVMFLLTETGSMNLKKGKRKKEKGG